MNNVNDMRPDIMVTDLAISELLEDEVDQGNNELLDLLDFYRKNGTPLTSKQVKAQFLMRELGFSDIADFANNARPQLTKPKKFFALIEKITLADRIKGNAKLSNLLKANVASTSGQMPIVTQAPNKKPKEV